MKTKQVIVVRKDLNMRKGKMSAQSSHGSFGVFSRRMQRLDMSNPFIKLACFFLKRAHVDVKKLYNCSFTEEMEHWLDSSYAKIVVGCQGEGHLHMLKAGAENLGIPYCLIKDNGQTEFKDICPKCEGLGKLAGENDMADIMIDCLSCEGKGKINRPTYTVIALGPDHADKIDILTKDLDLL